MTAVDSSPRPAAGTRRAIRQFVKFCMVGAVSTLIDNAVYLLLMEVFRLDLYVGGLTLARPLAGALAFLAAVCNGFYWHSRWTFRGRPDEAAGSAGLRYLLTNIAGFGINLTVLTVVVTHLPLWVTHPLDPWLRDPAGFVAKACATAIVVFWNFSVSKLWAFRDR